MNGTDTSAVPPARPAGNPWVGGRFVRGRPRHRLICLPQSGGSGSTFSSWRPWLPDGVEVVSVELPGRGARGDDPLPTNMDVLVDDLLAGLRDELATPYTIFGHSFGALLGYETVRRIQRRGLPLPQALLASASRAPHVPPRKKVSERDDTALLAWLLDNGGIPSELLRYSAFVAYVMRAIRADLMLAESYHVAEPDVLACPLHVFGGSDDRVSPPADLPQWQGCAGGGFSVTVLPGGHSYPYTDPEAMLRAITQVLAVPAISRGPGGSGEKP